MKRKTLFVFCLLSALVMAGCSRKNTESAVPTSVTEENGGETGNVSQGGETEEVSGELTFRGKSCPGRMPFYFLRLRKRRGLKSCCLTVPIMMATGTGRRLPLRV